MRLQQSFRVTAVGMDMDTGKIGVQLSSRDQASTCNVEILPEQLPSFPLGRLVAIELLPLSLAKPYEMHVEYTPLRDEKLGGTDPE